MTLLFICSASVEKREIIGILKGLGDNQLEQVNQASDEESTKCDGVQDSLENPANVELIQSEAENAEGANRAYCCQHRGFLSRANGGKHQSSKGHQNWNHDELDALLALLGAAYSVQPLHSLTNTSTQFCTVFLRWRCVLWHGKVQSRTEPSNSRVPTPPHAHAGQCVQ